MRHWTIQLRLAGWYLASVAVIVALFAVGSWLAMKASLYHAIDRDLRRRIEVVVPFIQNHSLNSAERFGSAFADSSDSSIVGVFIQITGERGDLLYESDVLRKHNIPLLAPRQPGEPISIETAGESGWPLRVVSKHLVVVGVGLDVHVVEPLHDVLASLREYTFDLCLLVTVALFLATAVGYWLSRRALLPVEQIRSEAQAVDPKDLSARLPVPTSDDELSRLAQTLNAMLYRIERGFHSVQQFTADASRRQQRSRCVVSAHEKRCRMQ